MEKSEHNDPVQHSDPVGVKHVPFDISSSQSSSEIRAAQSSTSKATNKDFVITYISMFSKSFCNTNLFLFSKKNFRYLTDVIASVHFSWSLSKGSFSK